MEYLGDGCRAAQVHQKERGAGVDQDHNQNLEGDPRNVFYVRDGPLLGVGRHNDAADGGYGHTNQDDTNR